MRRRLWQCPAWQVARQELDLAPLDGSVLWHNCGVMWWTPAHMRKVEERLWAPWVMEVAPPSCCPGRVFTDGSAEAAACVVSRVAAFAFVTDTQTFMQPVRGWRPTINRAEFAALCHACRSTMTATAIGADSSAALRWVAWLQERARAPWRRSDVTSCWKPPADLPLFGQD